jgi:hypothetical protein
MKRCLNTGPDITRSLDRGLKPPSLWSKNKQTNKLLVLVYWLISGISYRNRKLTVIQDFFVSPAVSVKCPHHTTMETLASRGLRNIKGFPFLLPIEHKMNLRDIGCSWRKLLPFW